MNAPECFRGLVFIWMVGAFFLIKSCRGSAAGVPIGFFELQIVRVQNTAGELYTGNCCDGTRSNYGCHKDECDTFFRLCLKEYQLSGSETESDSCTFGTGTSTVLGRNSFTLENIEDPSNPGRLKIPLLFTWTRTFTLILEAFDEDGSTGSTQVINAEEQLIDQHIHSGLLNPKSDWHTVNHNGPTARVEYRVRVRCNVNYYGYNCTKFCKPRDGYHGHYTCDRNGNKQCLLGWRGKDCNKPQCRLGCHAEHGSCNEPNECKCELGWKGDLCTECMPYPGCEHGTCTSPWQCHCDTNWGGLLCNKNLNYCGTHHPCRNGGTCTNPQPDRFECLCMDGYSGTHCEIAEFSCVSNPCLHGGTCLDQGTQFQCVCPAGWTGSMCQTNIDDCYPSPCRNGGACHDLVNGFRCDCPPHWEGATCQLDADECEHSPCIHARSCRNLPGHYYCECESGWEGVNCDLNVDECLLDKCENGATCVDMINGFRCVCPPGYTGERCEGNVNECESDPCLKGGKCVDEMGSFVCICPSGSSGRLCELNEGHCEPNPCENGAQCFNRNNHYYCNCSSMYEGKNCSVLRDVCRTQPCQVIDFCTIRVPSNSTGLGYAIESSEICGDHGVCVDLDGNDYECECDPGYTGKHCQLNVDDCADVHCQHGGTCIDGINTSTCVCVDGWEGEVCQRNVNDCLLDPCQDRGECVDLDNDFVCRQCRGNWKGKTCSSDEYCSENTCANGGTCVAPVDSFDCQCPPEWTGPFCNTRAVSVCASHPCVNGGTCVGSDDSFECSCAEGFEGALCQENIDDCAPQPCYNDGLCVDGINHYTCKCLDGFDGPDCRINIDECLSSPCAIASVCFDKIGDYECKCPPGRTGKNCDEVIGLRNSCYYKGDSHPDQSEWKSVCNTCECEGGVSNCTQMWCGEDKCGPSISCPLDQSCRAAIDKHDCFSRSCRARSYCYPDLGLFLPWSSSKCLPNADSLPESNCFRVKMFFNLSLVPQNIWVQDICMSLRLLPDLLQLSRSTPLILRCAIDEKDGSAIHVTVTSNSSSGSDVAKAVAIKLSKMTRSDKKTNVYFDSLERSEFFSSTDTNYLTTLLAALGAVLFALLALALLVCYCVIQRHRKRHSSDRGKVCDSIEGKIAPDEEGGKWKGSEGEINNKKMTNHQEQRRIVLDVNQLQTSKAADRKSRDDDDPSPMKEKLSAERKQLINPVEDEEADSLQEEDVASVHYSSSMPGNDRHRHRDDLIEVVSRKLLDESRGNLDRYGNHYVTPVSSARHAPRLHQAYPHRHHPRAILHPEESQPLSVCLEDGCHCDGCSPHSVYTRPTADDYSESEESTRLMPRNPHPSCCSCERPRRQHTSSHRCSDPRHLRSHRYSSSNHEDDLYYAESDARGRLRGSSSRHILRSTAEETLLPPYDSVVHPSCSRASSSSCGCSRHLPPSSGASEHFLHSPPPSYSHHPVEVDTSTPPYVSPRPLTGPCQLNNNSQSECTDESSNDLLTDELPTRDPVIT